MKVTEVYRALDAHAPFASAEPWDNVGLLVGDGDSEVTGILTALDVTLPVIEEAVRLGCTLLVSHHPVLFSAQKRFLVGDPAYEAARRGLSVLSAHTNYDAAPGGVNAILAETLGLLSVRPLAGEGQPLMGCMGELPCSHTPAQLAAVLKAALGLAPRYNPLGGESILTVGICGGSGADLMLERDAPHAFQAFITADVKHHEFLEAARRGVTLYDAGHFATEAIAMPALTLLLQEAFPSCKVLAAKEYSGELL